MNPPKQCPDQAANIKQTNHQKKTNQTPVPKVLFSPLFVWLTLTIGNYEKELSVYPIIPIWMVFQSNQMVLP